MRQPALIAVDWGTSALRAALVARDGTLLAERSGGPGILAVAANGFGAALGAFVQSWRDQHGHLPILLSGMIGSRQGWVEVPYLACPADVGLLAKALLPHDAGALGTVHIAPGLAVDPPNAAPDVMRGEETQIAGALHAASAREGLFVLPGTHSKWVNVSNGRIEGFATYMTGEVFAALRQHTILGRLMPDESGRLDTFAFRRGVEASAAEGPPGALLHRVFATRTLGLFDRLPAASLSSYLSGLLIGSEMSAACAGEGLQRAFTIVGSAPALTEHYRTAASILDLEARVAPADCAARGAFVIACAAGLIAGFVEGSLP
jgi:2-dehydro-3-deoxygalactonokinase